jgi:NAD(P)-dependent dehydrogenase (short-subunit alcohol dehydrogenase family)
MVKRVAGKVAVITGAALGIRKATALLLAREGAKVAVTDINDESGTSVVDEINAAGGLAQYWHLDTSDEDGVETVFLTSAVHLVRSTSWSITRVSPV